MSDTPTPRTDEADKKCPMDRHTLAFARNLEIELNGSNRQKITLSKAMNEGTGDACVDSGEFTYNDWMEIRRRLLKELSVTKTELMEAESARDSLLEYAHHGPCCPRHQDGRNRVCDCGLKELMDKIESTPVKTAS